MVDRVKNDYFNAAEILSEKLFKVANSSRKDRIKMRNKCEDLSEYFDWKNLYLEYEKAYKLAAENITSEVGI